MTKEEFFIQVDLILGEQHPGKTLGYGRWRRNPGAGRYPGIGLVRYHSDAHIYVFFHTPSFCKIFCCPESALKEISNLMIK